MEGKDFAGVYDWEKNLLALVMIGERVPMIVTT